MSLAVSQSCRTRRSSSPRCSSHSVSVTARSSTGRGRSTSTSTTRLPFAYVRFAADGTMQQFAARLELLLRLLRRECACDDQTTDHACHARGHSHYSPRIRPAYPITLRVDPTSLPRGSKATVF